MVEFQLNITDLAGASFRISALQETVFSLRAWRFPAVHPEHRAGLELMRPAFARLDAALLGSMVSPSRWIPDFLTPRTAVADSAAERNGGRDPGSIGAELAAVRATDPRAAIADIKRAYQGAPVPAVLADADPARLPGRLADELGAYWDGCIRPHWPRFRAVLRADIVHRSLIAARSGLAGVLASLDPRLSWSGGILSIDDPALAPVRIDVAGRGMVLTPTLFHRRPGTFIDPGLPPLLFYPARGRGTIWQPAASQAPAPLTGLIGGPRARLLSQLALPATTTQLAAELAVTPGAVSQHLSALYRAGLLDRIRHGREVWYARNGVGDHLAAAGAEPGQPVPSPPAGAAGIGAGQHGTSGPDIGVPPLAAGMSD